MFIIERYEGDPWEVDPASLKTICESCHEAEHAAAAISILQRDGREFRMSTAAARRLAAGILNACDQADAEAGLTPHGRQ